MKNAYPTITLNLNPSIKGKVPSFGTLKIRDIQSVRTYHFPNFKTEGQTHSRPDRYVNNKKLGIEKKSRRGLEKNR